jgi:hypothetical protein
MGHIATVAIALAFIPPAVNIRAIGQRAEFARIQPDLFQASQG